MPRKIVPRIEGERDCSRVRLFHETSSVRYRRGWSSCQRLRCEWGRALWQDDSSPESHSESDSLRGRGKTTPNQKCAGTFLQCFRSFRQICENIHGLSL